MSKINRPDKNIQPFAVDAQSLERTVFGESWQSNELADNLTESFSRGWGIVGSKDAPRKQDFNALGFTLGSLITHLYQEGISPWSDKQEYNEGAYTRYNGKIYVSLADENINFRPDTVSKWKPLQETATVEEALAGLSNEKLMTPAMVKAAMDQFGLFGHSLKVNDLYSDMNDIDKSGFYYVNPASDLDNTPPAFDTFMFMVIRETYSSYYKQIAFLRTGHTIMMRSFQNEAWTEWIQIYPVPHATTTQAGLMSAADKTKLDDLSADLNALRQELNALKESE